MSERDPKYPPDADTVLSDGFIIELFLSNGRSAGEILWGNVEKDFKHGWRKGDYACTTLITKCIDKLFYTKNSIYQLLTEPSYIKLPLQELPDLRAGIDPYLILLKLEKGYKITIVKD